MQISPVTRHSYRQAAQVLARAFVDEPVSVAVFQNFSPERRVKALAVDFTAGLLACMRRGYPLQLELEGRIIAAAAIYPPGAYPLPTWDGWVLLAKSILGNGFYDIRSWIRWLDELDKNHPSEPHYYVEYVGVDPGYQGRALGSTLLRHLVDKADEEQVGCYLESANPHNISFYQRLDFQIMKEMVIIGLPTWFMWRPPGNK
jgi:ribosomal protein S18 acetylase RimI-like enzyme